MPCHWHETENYLEIDHRLNPLTCVPADCNSLIVDGHFVPFVADCLEQPAKLQHPAIKFRERPPVRQTYGRDPFLVLRNMSHLTSLRSLKVEIPRSHADGLASLGDIPKSLTSLYIGVWGEDDVIVSLPDPQQGWRRESECLLVRGLANLELHACYIKFFFFFFMHICVGSIACLEGLTSMSIFHCQVGRDLHVVSKLTNLVSLELTGVKPPQGSDPQEQQSWSKFEAGPALRVLVFAVCWLNDKSIGMDIATVQEVHTDRLTTSMEAANIHLVLRHMHDPMLGSLADLSNSGWCTCNVDLRVIVNVSTVMVSHLPTVVYQVLEALLFLQPLHFAGGCNTMSPSDVTKKGYGSIVLGDGYSGQLNELKLQEMLCTLLDLGVATCLTSISLKNTDRQGVSCELILPVSLVRLEFLGDSLTTWHAKCLLQGLPSLTHVKLGLNRYEFLREPELISSPCMPAVPGSCSLRW